MSKVLLYGVTFTIDIKAFCHDDYIPYQSEDAEKCKDIEIGYGDDAIEMRKTKENTEFCIVYGIFEECSNGFLLNSQRNSKEQSDIMVSPQKYEQIVNNSEQKVIEINDREVCNNNEFANRRDVVYKNLLRGTRRYLWSLISEEFDCSKLINRRCYALYKEYISKFYDTHFRKFGREFSDDYHNECMTVLSIFASSKYSFSNKSEELKDLSSLAKSAMKSFVNKTYTTLFSFSCVSKFFQLLIDSKTEEKIIYSNQCMKKSNEIYTIAFQNIVDFAKDKTLLPRYV